jgi:hypothetical protein
MGIADVRKAFADALGAYGTVTKATKTIDRHDGVEYDRLEFEGVFVADNAPFTIRSDRIRPGGDLATAARLTAEGLLKQRGIT